MSEAERRCEIYDGSDYEIPAGDHGSAPAGARGAMAEKVCSTIAETVERLMTLTCAESLTEGALYSAFVETPGVSMVLHSSITAYTVDLRASILEVDGELLRTKGLVGERVVLDIARGACRVMGADVALAATDVAGPGPTDGHAIRTVWVAHTGKLNKRVHPYRPHGSRSDARAQAIEATVGLLTKLLCVTFR